MPFFEVKAIAHPRLSVPALPYPVPSRFRVPLGSAARAPPRADVSSMVSQIRHVAIAVMRGCWRGHPLLSFSPPSFKCQ